ncbi:MAG: carbohydrate ABC transporter permease [Frankia sp.]
MTADTEVATRGTARRAGGRGLARDRPGGRSTAPHRPGGPAPRARPWLYVGPATISLVVWVYGPLVFTGVLSFLRWNLVSTHPSWAGWDNYARLVDQPEFPHAAWHTALYALGILPFATVVPLSLAIMLWKRPGAISSGYRALLFLPVVLAPVANAIAWQFILDPLQGAANGLLHDAGFGPRNWLGDPATALPVIVLITAAKVVGLNLLLFGAALASLDRRTLEAARLEGATEWETTRFVVVPQLRRTTVLLGLLSLVVVWPWIFTNVAVLTQGGPDGATDNVYYRLYTYAFTFFDAGTASAAAIVITIAFAVLLGTYAAIGRRHRPGPAGFGPAGSGPAGSEPTGSEPTGSEPAGSAPTPGRSHANA